MLAPVIQISAVRAARAARRPVAHELCALNQALEQLAYAQLRFWSAVQRDTIRIVWGV